MYCKNCGSQIDDDSKFCDKCGQTISKNEENNSNVEQSSNEKKDNEQILYLKPGSIILPLKMIKEDTNTILYQYKVLKAISDEIENKKAV